MWNKCRFKGLCRGKRYAICFTAMTLLLFNSNGAASDSSQEQSRREDCILKTNFDALTSPTPLIQLLATDSSAYELFAAHGLVESAWSEAAFYSLYYKMTQKKWVFGFIKEKVLTKSQKLVRLELHSALQNQISFISELFADDSKLVSFMRQWAFLTIETSPESYKSALKLVLKPNTENFLSNNYQQILKETLQNTVNALIAIQSQYFEPKISIWNRISNWISRKKNTASVAALEPISRSLPALIFTTTLTMNEFLDESVASQIADGNSSEDFLNRIFPNIDQLKELNLSPSEDGEKVRLALALNYFGIKETAELAATLNQIEGHLKNVNFQPSWKEASAHYETIHREINSLNYLTTKPRIKKIKLILEKIIAFEGPMDLDFSEIESNASRYRSFIDLILLRSQENVEPNYFLDFIKTRRFQGLNAGCELIERKFKQLKDSYQLYKDNYIADSEHQRKIEEVKDLLSKKEEDAGFIGIAERVLPQLVKQLKALRFRRPH